MGGRYLFGMMFSFAGFIFLLIVGALLKLQPLYMHNAKQPSSTATSCFEAGALYGVAACVCYVFWRREKLRSGEMGFISDTFSRGKGHYDMESPDEKLPLAQNMSPTPHASSPLTSLSSH